MSKLKVLVQFSGGKDSTASLIWAIKESGYEKKNIKAIFCDTGFENPKTYDYIYETVDTLGVELVVLKSNKYDNFFDLTIKRKQFPSLKKRFCTEELKIKPMIDYVLDTVKDHFLTIQGIRKMESKSRSLMNESCTFFKSYFVPTFDKNNKEKYFTYRKKDVIDFRKNGFVDEVFRPVFNFSEKEVIHYILKNGLKPNPLYYEGFSRVGCFPCVMARKSEVKLIVRNYNDSVNKIKEIENEYSMTFFKPNYIPKQFCSRTNINKKGEIVYYPTFEDVTKYLKDNENQLSLFNDDMQENQSCMSSFNICE